MTTSKQIESTSLPPAREQAAEPVFTSAPVTIKLLDGGRIKGQLMHLNGPGQDIVVKSDDSRLHRAFMSNIKYIVFLRPVKPEVASAAGSGGENEYHIVYENKEVMQGMTSGFELDEDGIHLFREASQGQLLRVFVPYSAIHDYRIGPKIGHRVIPALSCDQFGTHGLQNKAQKRGTAALVMHP